MIQDPARLNMDGDSEHVTGWGRVVPLPKTMSASEISRKTATQGHTAFSAADPCALPPPRPSRNPSTSNAPNTHSPHEWAQYVSRLPSQKPACQPGILYFLGSLLLIISRFCLPAGLSVLRAPALSSVHACADTLSTAASTMHSPRRCRSSF